MNEINIALFVNSDLGLRILKFLHSKAHVKIKFIAINDENKRRVDFLQELKQVLSNLELKIPIIENNFLNSEKLPDFDYGISAMYGHIIHESLIKKAKIDFINLHPSPLPIGRGANPISWSILENRRQGASIHKLEKRLDAGAIYLQREIEFGIDANAGEVYLKLTELLFEMFKDFFQDWTDGNLEPIAQIEIESTPHRALDLGSIRKIKAQDKLTCEQFVRRIQSLCFSNGTSAIYEDVDGVEWEIRLTLQPKNKFVEARE